eukprot:gnl/TRDRNA2_/TRDRNA2_162092_c0_seq1.p1 gnl/TRDRNA2_/TRDRNA2_162092_c0~~gnl/TRDRNA2_/TRDRNA2_162092_c0_seq1.p1  ORF type:complete len:701 (+),score=136.76 gnl/TRDRNA2_/TRDRNA2_162092_c0_seq1:273-2105(+)
MREYRPAVKRGFAAAIASARAQAVDDVEPDPAAASPAKRGSAAAIASAKMQVTDGAGASPQSGFTAARSTSDGIAAPAGKAGSDATAGVPAPAAERKPKKGGFSFASAIAAAREATDDAASAKSLGYRGRGAQRDRDAKRRAEAEAEAEAEASLVAASLAKAARNRGGPDLDTAATAPARSLPKHASDSEEEDERMSGSNEDYPEAPQENIPQDYPEELLQKGGRPESLYRGSDPADAFLEEQKKRAGVQECVQLPSFEDEELSTAPNDLAGRISKSRLEEITDSIFDDAKRDDKAQKEMEHRGRKEKWSKDMAKAVEKAKVMMADITGAEQEVQETGTGDDRSAPSAVEAGRAKDDKVLSEILAVQEEQKIAQKAEQMARRQKRRARRKELGPKVDQAAAIEAVLAAAKGKTSTLSKSGREALLAWQRSLGKDAATAEAAIAPYTRSMRSDAGSKSEAASKPLQDLVKRAAHVAEEQANEHQYKYNGTREEVARAIASQWDPSKVDKWFACDAPRCRRVLITRQVLKEHRIAVHNYIHECIVGGCYFIGKQAKDLSIHLRREHIAPALDSSQKVDFYPCTAPGCVSKFETVRKLSWHLKVCHSDTVPFD